MTEHKRLTPTQIYIRVATIIALPLALVALIPAAYATYRVWEVADDARSTAEENRTATCSFVFDLRERYNATELYLTALDRREFPPPPGVDLKAIRESQVNRKATLDSFQDLDCTKEGEE